jgi:hypothetical protein
MRCWLAALLTSTVACAAHADNQPGEGPRAENQPREGSPRGPENQPREGEGPLVVELFTSQGCSSCPPADQLLSSFVKAGAVSGRPVAALSFHVDYWNDLGWADPI